MCQIAQVHVGSPGGTHGKPGCANTYFSGLIGLLGLLGLSGHEANPRYWTNVERTREKNRANATSYMDFKPGRFELSGGEGTSEVMDALDIATLSAEQRVMVEQAAKAANITVEEFVRLANGGEPSETDNTSGTLIRRVF